jgi:hypothetical protein
MPRTTGGVDYEVPEPLEENVMGQAPTETYLYPLGRVILRLEEILESRENEIEFFRDLDRANRDMLDGQMRRIVAAEDKIDELHRAWVSATEDGPLTPDDAPEVRRA